MSLSKKVLVTGGAGFIGAHVAERLVQKGYQVTVLDDLSGGFRDNVPTAAEFVEGSILNLPLLEKLFEKHRFSYVFHLAAYAAEGLSPFIRKFNYENNLIGSINLINLSIRHKIARFVFTSSIAVYGKNQLPMREDLTPQPEDPYGVAKYAVEQDLKCAHEQFGLDSTIFRPHNVYGKKQNIGDRYRNVIGIFMNQLMQNLPLTIFGDGTQTRAFSYVDEVSFPIADCIEIPNTANQVFNIGADQAYTILELAKTVQQAIGKEGLIRFEEARNEVLHAYADHSKVREYFKSLPRSLNLQEGIERMAKWALKEGPRKTKIFTGIEISEKLPPLWAKEFENVGR